VVTFKNGDVLQLTTDAFGPSREALQVKSSLEVVNADYRIFIETPMSPTDLRFPGRIGDMANVRHWLPGIPFHVDARVLNAAGENMEGVLLELDLIEIVIDYFLIWKVFFLNWI